MRERLGIRPGIRHWDLYLNVLTRTETLHRLIGMHLSRRTENDRIHVGAGKRLSKILRDVGRAIFLGNFTCLIQISPDQETISTSGMFLGHPDAFGQRRRGLPGQCRLFCSCLCVLQNEMANSRIRGRHMEESMPHSRFFPPATSAIAPRAISHITNSIPSDPASRT